MGLFRPTGGGFEQVYVVWSSGQRQVQAASIACSVASRGRLWVSVKGTYPSTAVGAWVEARETLRP
jgi:hypothetical protein